MTCDVVAVWRELKGDSGLTKLDRIVGATVARAGRVLDSGKLARSLGGYPNRANGDEVARSIIRLRERGHLVHLEPAARKTVADAVQSEAIAT